MKRSFVVSLEMPRYTTVAEMNEYIRKAVASSCGNMDPNDLLYELNRASVEVKHIPKRRKRS